MTGSAKQSMVPQEKHGLLRRFSAKLLCNFVAELLAMTESAGQRIPPSPFAVSHALFAVEEQQQG
jgi:hypothetical protein